MTDNVITPPVYTAVSTSDNPRNEDSPPSYSVISQIRAAKADSKNPIELGTKAVSILCGSVFFSVILIISCLLPIAMLVIGLISREKCIIQQNIPLWLIVSGAAGITSAVIKFFLNMIECIKTRKSIDKKGGPMVVNCFLSLLGLFMLVWFILGNVWVYSIRNTVQYDQALYPNHYCDKLCYMFSFWAITASWILIALGCCCLFGIICCAVGISSITSCFSK